MTNELLFMLLSLFIFAGITTIFAVLSSGRTKMIEKSFDRALEGLSTKIKDLEKEVNSLKFHIGSINLVIENLRRLPPPKNSSEDLESILNAIKTLAEKDEDDNGEEEDEKVELYPGHNGNYL